MSEALMVRFETEGVITVATVESTKVLDAVNVGQFGQELQAYLKGKTGVHLLVDFQRVEYLSSAVLTELLRAKKAVTEGGGDIRLCSLSPEIRKVFEITNLDQIFTLETDRDTALPRYFRSLQLAEQEASWKQSHQ